MRQFPRASSFIFAVLYLLIINNYVLSLYLGAVSSDIYNYISDRNTVQLCGWSNTFGFAIKGVEL